ncbi:alkyl sulfatase C-terminal domain-containing protein [Streptomyces olindensis]|uniref:alkyl sulfatase C-terminal domain-containing protein n=1 Tax=Streptomyces olindensis TaxID=358823 RepID=UPI0033F363E6
MHQSAPSGRPSGGAEPDLVAGMTAELVRDYLPIRLNGRRAAARRLRIGLEVDGDRPDHADERSLVIVENGILRYAPPPVAETPAGTLRIRHAALADLAYGAATLDELLAKDTARVDGDRPDLDTLLGLLDTFTGAFEVVVPNLR